MNSQLLKESIANTAKFAFSRSGGPGGQNVNKVSTRVQISVDINALDGLSSTEKNRIINKLAYRLKDTSWIALFVDEERSQFRNREIGILRVLKILIEANHLEKRRIPTKPKRSAKIARLNSKKVRGSVKSLRHTPTSDN